MSRTHQIRTKEDLNNFINSLDSGLYKINGDDEK